MHIDDQRVGGGNKRDVPVDIDILDSHVSKCSHPSCCSHLHVHHRLNAFDVHLRTVTVGLPFR